MRIFTKVACILGILCLFGDAVWSQASLVKDIYQGSVPASGIGSEPSNMVEINGVTYFTARDKLNGAELWKTDGTKAGTMMVKNISPGISGGHPGYLVEVNGTLFFTAYEPTHGFELWKSDGTESGTVMVKDILPGSGGSGPYLLTAVNNTLFFQANNDTHGVELWKSDGTAAGTVMVKDIYSGSGNSNPEGFTEVNGTLFFTAFNKTYGQELWKSDGTAAGTVLVKDILPGSNSGGPSYLAAMNGTLFFRSYDNIHGTELWKSDGTTVGTVMIKDINPGINYSAPQNLTVVNGTLFFRADDGIHGTELWKSNGTAAGTVMVKDIYSGSSHSQPQDLTAVNGTLFFEANDGTLGLELWKSDGTSSGTTMVKDIYGGGGSSNPGYLTVVNSTLFFQAADILHGFELWKSDGTEAGTELVKDIHPNSSSSPTSLIAVNGSLLFQADDNVHGAELWKSDGTEAGTLLVKDIHAELGSSNPQYLTEMNSTLYFTSEDDTHGTELWKSDGTESGTVLVKDIFPGNEGSDLLYLAEMNGTLFFGANDGNKGMELWKSDGTAAGTMLVKDITNGGASSLIYYLTVVDNTIFFSSTGGSTGYELWKSDGTEAGTMLVKDIRVGSGHAFPTWLTAVNGTLFFVAIDDIHGYELWKSDGTEAGTVMVKDLNPGGSSNISYLAAVNGTLFFRGSSNNGLELWKSDGTEAGTVMVKDINPGSDSGNPEFLTAMNGMMYFVADDGTNGPQLWKSDGTAEGTLPVDIGNHSQLLSSVTSFFAVDDILYFAASSGAEGLELWRTDGTAAGTFMAADINAGFGSSNPAEFANMGQTLYFQATEGINGTELWKYEPEVEALKFTLVNAATNTDITKLTEGMQLNANELPDAPFSIRVDFHTSGVGSIAIDLSGAKNVNHTENLAPYTLFGDEKGSYTGENFPVGNYTISGTIYSERNGTGSQGESMTINFSIVEDALSFTLVNAATNTDIAELSEGLQLNANELPDVPFSIRIDTDASNVGSIVMNLSGTKNVNHTENLAPYTLFGDEKGSYTGEAFGVGNYTISGTIYSERYGTGVQGASVSINFSIEEDEIEDNLSFTLVNAATNTDIIELSEGMQLKADELPDVPFSIRVDTYNSEVGSVVMKLSGAKNVNHTENSLPYTLFGDEKTSYTGEPFPVGNYTFSSTIYSGRNGSGNKGESLTINFSIEEDEIEDNLSFTLVNAATNTDITQLSQGMQLHVNELPDAPFSIRVDPKVSGVGSIRISLNGAKNENHTENLAPYTLFGDDEQGSYTGKGFGVGNYTISGSAYSGRNNSGSLIASTSINFSIVGEVSACASFAVALNNVKDVSICGGKDGSATASVSGNTGAISYNWSNGATTATASNLSPGSYTVTVSDAQGCSVTASVTIAGPSSPNVTLAPFSAVSATDPAFSLSGGSPAGGIYSGAGVSNGKFNPSAAGNGIHEITYTYTDPVTKCTNTASQQITVGNEVITFMLVNTATQQDLFSLNDNSVVDLSVTGMEIGIRADVSVEGTVKKVKFKLTGKGYKHTTAESDSPPFSLFGDIGETINPWPTNDLQEGDYQLKADAIIKNQGVKEVFTKAIGFTVINGTTAGLRTLNVDRVKGEESFEAEFTKQIDQTVRVYPNPFARDIQIEIPHLSGEYVVVHLMDLYGKTISKKSVEVHKDNPNCSVDATYLPNGTYLLEVRWDDHVKVIKLIKDN